MIKKIKANTFRSLVCFAVALGLVAGVSIRTAMAYFTTYCDAVGGLPIYLHTDTDIQEPDVVEGVKIISISNSEDAVQSVYVRARAFSGDDFTVTVISNGWTQVGDWMYYDGIVGPGKSTYDVPAGDINYSEHEANPGAGELIFKVGGLDSEKYKVGDKMEVPVVYETIAVQFNDEGEVIPATEANWDLTEGDLEAAAEGGE